jgi:flagellar biogenesis protein FliO
MPSLPVSSGSSAGLAFNKVNQAFQQHKAIVASSFKSNSSAESQHVSMATMFLVALSCIAAVGLLIYLVRCLISMCSDDSFQKALDEDR